MTHRLLPACLLMLCINPAFTQTPDIELLWRLPGLDNPESVALSEDSDFLYVSNVNGSGGDKDGNGYIARISLSGELLERGWASGLNAPKGIALLDGVLYVSDIDQLVLIDTATGEIKKRIDVPGAGFLNDVAVDSNGHILVSDSRGGSIYRLDNKDQISVWHQSDSFSGINGLFPNGDHILINTMDKGELLSMDSTTMTITSLAAGMKNADGLAPLPGGGHVVSAWPGQLFYISPEGDRTELLNTTEDEIFMNDFILLGDILIVPNWQPGSLSAYRLRWQQSE